MNPEARAQLQRTAVVGVTGSGKTTLAQTLADAMRVPHVELDALYWEQNWQPVEREVLRARVVAALAGPGWTIDGNYRQVRDLIWPRATAVVWLDYPLPLILWRLAVRTARRLLTREELWNGNRERLRDNLLSRDSIFLWALQTHARRRREYSALLALPENAHLAVFHFRGPRATARWLKTLD